MTDAADPFLLGPLGKLTAMPSSSVGDDIRAPYRRTAAVQESLTGGTTVDVLGVHREWEFGFSWRLAAELDRLIARYNAPGAAPLRLRDPVTVNLTSIDASHGGGVTRSTVAALASAGTLAHTLPATMPGEVDGILGGAYLWSLANAQSGNLLLDQPVETRIPALASTPVSVGIWATGTTTATPFIRPYDAAGAALADVDGSPTALSGAWQRLTQLNVSPSGSAVGFGFGLKVATTTGARTVTATAPLVVYGATLPALWSPGGGAPRVVLLELDTRYMRLGYRGASLVVREA